MAFLAFMGSVLGLFGPISKAIQQISATTASEPVWVRLLGWVFIGVVCLFSATPPFFYFAVFRSEGNFQFPKRFRLLAFTGIGCLGLFEGGSFQWLITTVTPRWPGAAGLDPVLTEVANAAPILLLVAFVCCSDNDVDGDVPDSRELRIATKAAVLTYGLFFGYLLFCLVAVPLGYPLMRSLFRQSGMPIEPLGPWLSRLFLEALSSGGLLAAPYIVYACQKACRETQDEPIDQSL